MFTTSFANVEQARQVLAARLQEHGLFIRAQKDRPIKDDNLNAIMSAILGTIANFDKIPPRSKVKSVQDSASSWPGAKRRKIRYGPYRIPPITVIRPQMQRVGHTDLTLGRKS